MRPSHAYQQTSSAHSRPSSRNSSQSNSSAVASPSNVKSESLAAKAASNVASGLSGKRASASKKAAKEQRSEERSASPKLPQTPGLISLTKPLTDEMQASKPSASSRGRKGKETSKASIESSAGTPIKNGRSKKSKTSPNADPSPDLLSKSAPAEHGQQHPRTQVHDTDSAADKPGLTWQQELLASNNRSTPDVTQTNGRRPARKVNQQSTTKHDGNLAQPQKVGQDTAALTWQQELFNSQRHNGHDVFADARDAETFGDEPSSHNPGSARKSSKRRPRAGSFGSGTPKGGQANGKAHNADYPLHIDDLFDSSVSDSPATTKVSSTQAKHHAQYPPAGAPIHYDLSTPAKKIPVSQQQHPAVAAAIAYAGPNFHNSPSPASLPAPKFQSRLGKSANDRVAANSSSGDSGASDGETELVRGVRNTVTPAQARSSIEEPAATRSAANDSPAPSSKPSMQPGATVESLLARMMGGARFT